MIRCLANDFSEICVTGDPYAKVIDEFRRDAIQKLEALRDSKLSKAKESTEQLTDKTIESYRWVN
jgi:hypothetical protein